MNEREVQAFLSGLPKHVPQRTAKFRAGRSSATACTGYPAWAWWKTDA